MKSVIAASVLALMTSTSAFATDVDADIGQFAMGIQKALNKIEDATKVTGASSQEAVNAANLVSKLNAGDLTAIYQKSKVKQIAVNKIESPRFEKVDVQEVIQEATNVANSVSIGDAENLAGSGADALEKIKQSSFGDQFAMNKIEDADLAQTVEQTAVNAANLVTLAVDAGDVDEIMQKSFGEQTAINKIDSGWNWSWYWGKYRNFAVINGVEQAATNVANSISLGEVDSGNFNQLLDDAMQFAFVDQYASNEIKVAYTAYNVSQEAVNATNLITSDAADLGEVTQTAFGDQDALNTIEFKKWIDADALTPSTQSATNVINSVSAPEIRTTLAQFSAVDQKARNVADSVGDSSNVWDLNQTAVNAANLVSIGNIGGDLELDQVAFVSQNASNLIDANGMVDKVVQSATNVANSVGDLN
ncbi:hypothetical protein [Rhizobium rosettiformans]|uniref:hypothetical protein n=1 Tax=Rhizobium rosettiformans TaxID=1368430 RepID=UPI0028555B4D|nr:hypothetical protein [Rhizobium rosettiformans]MDR7029638.1 hypothetical protein [Rhizobium rosettiformans]MDR7063352.1 hypothetical protein [Rhizobium rosettiformans]